MCIDYKYIYLGYYKSENSKFYMGLYMKTIEILRKKYNEK